MNHLSDLSLTHIQPLSDTAPVVIGGIGGSGTRVVAQLLQCCDLNMGTDLNESLDDLSFTALFKRQALWPLAQHLPDLQEALEVYLSCRGCPPEEAVDPAHHSARALNLINKLAAETTWTDSGTLEERGHKLATMDPPPLAWGWKEPNSHIFLPYLLQALPNMKYVHVVRNGLEMAFSSNLNQLKLWGPSLLGRPVAEESPESAFAYWCAVNKRVLSLAASSTGRILILRFEELQQNPEAVVTDLLGRLGLSISDARYTTWVSGLNVDRRVRSRLPAFPLAIDDGQAEVLGRLGYNP